MNVGLDANTFKSVSQFAGLILEPAKSMDLFFLLEPSQDNENDFLHLAEARSANSGWIQYGFAAIILSQL